MAAVLAVLALRNCTSCTDTHPHTDTHQLAFLHCSSACHSVSDGSTARYNLPRLLRKVCLREHPPEPEPTRLLIRA